MATPLGTTFVTDEQIVAQDDVLRKGKLVESLVVEFDQAKFEEFLSSGSKSPKNASAAGSQQESSPKPNLRLSRVPLLLPTVPSKVHASTPLRRPT